MSGHPAAPGPIVAPVEPTAAPRWAARRPTGVPDFDTLTGGLPAGSVVLLFGEAGSGHHEFALTSAVRALAAAPPDRTSVPARSPVGPRAGYSRVAYISVTRSRRQVLDELAAAFGTGYPAEIDQAIAFHDLSPEYFSATSVPAAWATLDRPLLAARDPSTSGGGEPLERLAAALDADGPESLVIVDALTDLLVRPGAEPEALVAFVKGLRRQAKVWGGLVYLLLTRGVAPASTEHALVDSVDGVLSFGWSRAPNRSERRRVLEIEKFLTVLAHLPEERHGRFSIRVHPLTGLVTTQHERI